jgi:hypothetical protein
MSVRAAPKYSSRLTLDQQPPSKRYIDTPQNLTIQEVQRRVSPRQLDETESSIFFSKIKPNLSRAEQLKNEIKNLKAQLSSINARY